MRLETISSSLTLEDVISSLTKKELIMLLEEVLKVAHQNRREEADWLASNQGSD